MQAYVLTAHGGPEVLSPIEVPDPLPGQGEVLVDVMAAGLNRADIAQRMGRYPPPGPAPVHEIPGLEIAGVVAATGPGTTRHRVGDRVFGLLPGGGYAQRVVLPEAMAWPTPPELTDVAAAAIPEAFLTAWDALEGQAGLRAGERVLIHAAASGVGTAALQLARDAGATTYGTARSAAKCATILELGAAAAFEMTDPDRDFAADLIGHSGGEPVDVVLDLVGGSYLARNLAALGPHGRLVVLATVGGSRAEIDLGAVMGRRLRITGSGLRGRPLGEKAELAAAFERRVLPRLASGRLRPIVARVLPWTEAAQGHRLLEAAAVIGKVVLQVRRGDETGVGAL